MVSRSTARVRVSDMNVVRRLLALFLFAAGFAVSADSADRDPDEYFFSLSFGDLPEELELARESGKLGMLLFFEADECPYCQYMLGNVFNKRPVQDWFGNRYLNIAVDIHGDVEIQDFTGTTLPSRVFADNRGIFMTPVISFIDLEGVEIYRHLGMIKTAEEFLLLGRYVANEHYRDIEYTIFLETNGLARTDETLTTPAGEDDAT